MIWLIICAFAFGFPGTYLVLAAFIPVLRFKEWTWGHYTGRFALGGVDSPLYRKMVESRRASNLTYALTGVSCLLLMVPFLSGLNPTLIPPEIGIFALIASPFPWLAAAIADANPPAK